MYDLVHTPDPFLLLNINSYVYPSPPAPTPHPHTPFFFFLRSICNSASCLTLSLSKLGGGGWKKFRLHFIFYLSSSSLCAYIYQNNRNSGEDFVLFTTVHYLVVPFTTLRSLLFHSQQYIELLLCSQLYYSLLSIHGSAAVCCSIHNSTLACCSSSLRL